MLLLSRIVFFSIRSTPTIVGVGESLVRNNTGYCLFGELRTGPRSTKKPEILNV